MKLLKKILALGLLFASFCVSGQQWNPQTAYWIYGASYMNSSGDLRVSYVNDTVVHNLSCQVLQKEIIEYSYADKKYRHRLFGREVTYYEDGVTYILNNNQFDTLYYFSGKINDRYRITGRLAWDEAESSYAVITDTGSVTINGSKLKWQAVDFHFLQRSNQYTLRDTIIEKIGATRYYFLPWDFINGMVDGNEGGALKCFHDTTLGAYSSTNSTDCKFDLGLVESDSYEPFICDSKVWKHFADYGLLGGSDVEGILVFKSYFDGDSIINGLQYKVLSQNVEQPTWIADQNIYLVREDARNKKVYIYDSYHRKDTTLFDFNLKLNDTFSVYVANGLYLKSSVVKVDTIESFGKKLKRIVFNDSITWLEGIGPVTPVPIPFAGELLCVTNNGYPIYLDSRFSSCDTIFSQEGWGSSRFMRQAAVSLFPNPLEAASVLSVDTNQPGPFKIEIFRDTGALFKQDYFVESYSLGSLNLPSGFYIYRLVVPNRNPIAGKFLVR